MILVIDSSELKSKRSFFGIGKKDESIAALKKAVYDYCPEGFNLARKVIVVHESVFHVIKDRDANLKSFEPLENLHYECLPS